MGLLKNLLSGEDHPALPEDSYAVERIRSVMPGLRQLVSETNDRFEVVPAAESAYVFIGKPPKKFGMAWITGDKVANLGELAREKNYSPITLEKIEDELSAAYKRSDSDQRYVFSVDGQDVVVTPSQNLENEVDHIIQALLK
ncbi:MAG: hypothetical protein U5R46_10435 [Gammaproteobacteria bacterium]|nr:hypothetical protein [Gammaproteobacteria bacterium]